jgi:8-oxo-dGTP pyrophosphatase MutT (NUDIX family)
MEVMSNEQMPGGAVRKRAVAPVKKRPSWSQVVQGSHKAATPKSHRRSTKRTEGSPPGITRSDVDGLKDGTDGLKGTPHSPKLESPRNRIVYDKTTDKPIIKYRHSIGIVLFRRNPTTSGVEVMCVRKRSTYAYHSFVHAQYKSTSDDCILALLNKMTPEEKVDLLSLNFSQIWFRVWIYGTYRHVFYASCAHKFENNFCADKGARLQRLIQESTSGEIVWEIPKGRRDPNEDQLDCAIREFQEETDIGPSQYKFVTVGRNHLMSFTHYDEGVSYTNSYYIAVTDSEFEPTINFRNKHQVAEVSAIQWMSLSALEVLDSRRLIINFVRPIMKYLKKHKMV